MDFNDCASGSGLSKDLQAKISTAYVPDSAGDQNCDTLSFWFIVRDPLNHESATIVLAESFTWTM